MNKPHAEIYILINEEMQSSQNDPIIFYQEPSADGSSHFMLALATRSQRFMLEKYGHNIIAMDSTHGTNDYDFQFTTVQMWMRKSQR